MAGAIPTNPEDILKQEEAAESGTFSDECYILDYIDVLSMFNKCNGANYKNFIPVGTSDGSGAFEIISKSVFTAIMTPPPFLRNLLGLMGSGGCVQAVLSRL